ncbi:MAG: putative methyltransferase match [Frankiales bacterium]|nr:putative methyltransferase match [Frankiales bacterium]
MRYGMLPRVTSSEVWDEAAAARYDTDAASHFEPKVLDPTVDLLERLAEGGPALEFAIGTGRVGIPLAARGVPVMGIELSEPMVGQLRRKVSEDKVPVVIGDMAATVVPGAGRFSLVFLVWNSISNLRTQAEQVQCFRNAAHHLRPGGRFVIDLWVPPIQRLVPGQVAVPISIDEEHLVFDTYDLVTQECASHHYHRNDDGTVRHGVGHFRYIWPAECDLMAQLAGLELESRSADWAGSPFLATSGSHVSVWRKTTNP